jgi:protein CpxP
MRKTLSLSILLAAALGCSALALAAPGGQNGGGGQGWQGHHHGGGFAAWGKLDLTDAQKASIKQIMQSGFAQLKPQFQAVRQQRAAFQALTPDAAGYQTAAANLAQAEAALTSARITQRAASSTQIYAVLTSTQKTQLATQKAARIARQQQWQQFKAQHPVSSSTTTSAQ